MSIYSILLAVAVSQEKPAIVKELLKRDAPVDFRSSDGYSAFHWAYLRGNMDIVQLLLDAGAEISALTDKGFAGVHLAAQFGYLKSLELLLS